MTIKLVNADKSDLVKIRDLYWRLLDSSEEYEKILQWKKNIYPSDEDWLHYISTGEMYLAINGDELIGALVITDRQSENYRNTDWQIKVEDDEVSVIHMLVIDPGQQGLGYANKILDACTDIAREKKKKALRLDAIATNSPAQKLYEKYGFKRRGEAVDFYESTGFQKFIYYELLL